MGTGKIHTLDRQKISPWGFSLHILCNWNHTWAWQLYLTPYKPNGATNQKTKATLWSQTFNFAHGGTFLMQNSNVLIVFQEFFFSISFCCSQNVWVPRTRFQARAPERARTHVRSRLPSFFSLNRHTGKHAKCTLRAWRAFVFGTFLIDDAISTKFSDPEILKHQCSSFHPMSVDFR